MQVLLCRWCFHRRGGAAPHQPAHPEARLITATDPGSFTAVLVGVLDSVIRNGVVVRTILEAMIVVVHLTSVTPRADVAGDTVRHASLPAL